MVTIPCDGCGESIGLAERGCPGCGRALSPALRDARAARLAASSAPFRALEDAVHGATFAVLVLALVQLGLGLFLFALERSADALFDPDAHADAGRRLAWRLALGGGLLACSLAARVAPARGLVAALAWAALCLAASRADGSSSGSALGMMFASTALRAATGPTPTSRPSACASRLRRWHDGFGVASHAFLLAVVCRGVASAVRARLYAGELAQRAPRVDVGDAWDQGHAYRHGPVVATAPVDGAPWLARLPRVLSALLP